MVKHSLFLILLASALFSQSLDVAISGIMNKSEYIAKKKFIDIIFSDKDSYFDGSRVNYKKIITKLRNEGLIELAKNSQNLKVSFVTKDNNPQLFIKLIRDTLSTLGFSDINTIKSMKSSGRFVWIVSLGNNYMLDPLLFITELEKKSVYAKKIKRYTATNWNYELDTAHTMLVPDKLAFDDVIKLKKTLSAYWINIEGSKKVQIQSSKYNRWHPYVVVYDKNLKIISSISKDKVADKLKLNIPQDGVYLKIDDFYTIKNVKDGLAIHIQERK